MALTIDNGSPTLPPPLGQRERDVLNGPALAPLFPFRARDQAVVETITHISTASNEFADTLNTTPRWRRALRRFRWLILDTRAALARLIDPYQAP